MSMHNMSEKSLEQINFAKGRICGIDKKFISNYDEYKLLLDEMICPICLKVLLDPIECNQCQAIICENCYFILKSADKNCFNEGCKGTYIKANKFVREILSNLNIKCIGCSKDNIRYIDYLEHIKTCEEYLSNPILKKLVIINRKSEEIEKLKKEKEQLVKEARKRNMLTDQELRARYLTNKLQTTDKMNFYQAVIDGNLDAYKRYIQGTYGQPYNIFEEVSAPGYGWTTIHYAMHYAKWNIIKFIIEYLESQNKLEIGFRLKSKDGRCPLLCLLKSNALKPDVKRETFNKIITNFTVPVSDEVKKELNNRGLSDLIPKIRSFY
jgi:hypothetical protein